MFHQSEEQLKDNQQSSCDENETDTNSIIYCNNSHETNFSHQDAALIYLTPPPYKPPPAYSPHRSNNIYQKIKDTDDHSQDNNDDKEKFYQSFISDDGSFEGPEIII